jgi:periplasmic protein CpxP/Spy
MSMTENVIDDRTENVGAEAAHGRRMTMGRRRWWAVVIGAVAVAGLSLSVARAQGFGGGHGPFVKERVEHILSAVGATDAQKTQIHAIWDGLRPQIKPLRKQHADLRRQLGQAIAAPTIDNARVETLRKQSVDTMDRISALMTQGMVASAQVLTPDQRQAALKQMDEHHRHGGGHGEADDAGE